MTEASHAEFARFVREAREQRERAERAEAALDTIRRCAHDRLAEMSGEATTYEQAFRMAEVGAGALLFIEEHASTTLRSGGE